MMYGNTKLKSWYSFVILGRCSLFASRVGLISTPVHNLLNRKHNPQNHKLMWTDIYLQLKLFGKATRSWVAPLRSTHKRRPKP